MDEQEKETLAVLELSFCENVGNRAIFRLIEHFGSAQAALSASAGEIERVEGIKPAAREGIKRGAPKGAVAEEVDLAEKHGARIVPFFSEDYPEPLNELESDRPPLLRMKGEYLARDRLAVAIVGARRCTHYGRKQAARLAGGLAAMGFTVVSGLAQGIDAEGHRAALRVSGRTLAVTGCGLSRLYPEEHVELALQIAANGALLSELPMATPVRASNFAPRNRLISALALGVVVVEAAKHSGSLITARWAGEQGKAVMAVPGDVESPTSRGCHALIRDGAVLVEDARDVVESLGPLSQPLGVQVAESPAEPYVRVDDARALALNTRERQLFEMLTHSPRHIDSLIAETGLPVSIVSSTLLTLEVKGLVKQLTGSRYVRN